MTRRRLGITISVGYGILLLGIPLHVFVLNPWLKSHLHWVPITWLAVLTWILYTLVICCWGTWVRRQIRQQRAAEAPVNGEDPEDGDPAAG